MENKANESLGQSSFMNRDLQAEGIGEMGCGEWSSIFSKRFSTRMI